MARSRKPRVPLSVALAPLRRRLVPRMSWEVDVRQFRNAAGEFARFSEELRPRLDRWTPEIVQTLVDLSKKHIPSRRVPDAWVWDIAFRPEGTHIRMYLPSDWNRLAIFLLEGTKPHEIYPRFADALWWHPETKGYTHTRGAPNRPSKPIVPPPHPLAKVNHPGFVGYDYLTAMIEDPELKRRFGPGSDSVTTKIGKEAILTLKKGIEEVHRVRFGRRRRRGKR